MGEVTGLGHRLELRREAGGMRNYLAGKPVHAGDILELWKAGAWLRGRYEWTFRTDDEPVLYLAEDKAVCLSSADVLRWPGAI